ncbi:MAG: 1-deoxy-D-xylulose-5-phosphate synthase [Campylobacterota bacterium]|nr:1-deoxy-D-xylulose-5-phosphate synthase [Campylobacterota bacterium]
MNIENHTLNELEELCKEIRDKILHVVSTNGGHLSSSLGATELIVAMHKVFDSTKDPFIFDVSHQCYPHKLLTNRWDEFDTLREFNGTCGYTKPSESEHDYFVAGHSSTSISLGVGAAKAIELKNEQDRRVPVVMIGDGSMTAGMVYEALNELGDRKYPLIIILNDNEMSISSPIGAISRMLSSAMASPFYQKFKSTTQKFVDNFGEGANYMAKKFEESFKLITPGIMFEEMGIEYIGPIDGHNLKSIIETLEIAKALKKPVIIHAQTTKGKGYEIAEGKHEQWHGVGPFDLDSGKVSKKSSKKSSTQIFSEILLKECETNEKIVGVTAAMPSGTGLSDLIQKYPNRFWDVAIAEQHAVTSMAALAKEGFKPFCTIYSTFLQRGFDQVVHDVCLMDLGVVFALDRAGVVGEDGETHQGVFDISFLRSIPNMHIAAPCDEESFKSLIKFAIEFSRPLAIRYPRGSFTYDRNSNTTCSEFTLGKSQLLQTSNKNRLFIGYGNGVGRAQETIELLEDEIALLDLRFVKPLDTDMLKNLSKKHKEWYVFSDSVKQGGVQSSILEFLSSESINDVHVTSFEYEDNFITHGKTEAVEKYLEILPSQIAKKIGDTNRS